MKIKKTSNNKKTFIVASIVLLLIATPLIYVYAFNGDLFGWKKPSTPILEREGSSVNLDPPTLEQQQAGNNTKNDSTSDTPPDPAPIPGSDKKSVEVSITSANQNLQNNLLQIRAQIGAIDSAGTCTLTLTSPGKSTVTKTASTQPLASISTCIGFDVPLSEVTAGIWNVQVLYSSASLSGVASQEIEVRAQNE